MRFYKSFSVLSSDWDVYFMWFYFEEDYILQVSWLNRIFRQENTKNNIKWCLLLGSRYLSKSQSVKEEMESSTAK